MASSINSTSHSQNIKHEDEVESVTISGSSTGFIVVQEETCSQEESDDMEQNLSNDDNNKETPSTVSFSECITTIELDEEAVVHEEDSTPGFSGTATGNSKSSTSPRAFNKEGKSPTATPASYSTYKEDQEESDDGESEEGEEHPASSSFKSGYNMVNTGLDQGNTLFNRVVSPHNTTNGGSTGNATTSAASTGQTAPKHDPLSSFAHGVDPASTSSSSAASGSRNKNGGATFTIRAGTTPYSFSGFGKPSQEKKTSGQQKSSYEASTGGSRTTCGGNANVNHSSDAATSADNGDDRNEVYLKLHYYSKGSNSNSRSNNYPATTGSSSDGAHLFGGLGNIGGGTGGIIFGSSLPLGGGNGSSSNNNAGSSSSLLGYPATYGGSSHLFNSSRLTQPTGFVRYGDPDDNCLPHCIVNNGLGEICVDCGKTNFTKKRSSSDTTVVSSSSGPSGLPFSKKSKRSQAAGTTSSRLRKKRTAGASINEQQVATNEASSCDKISLIITGFMKRWVWPPLLIVISFILAEYLLGLISEATSTPM